MPVQAAAEWISSGLITVDCEINWATVLSQDVADRNELPHQMEAKNKQQQAEFAEAFKRSWKSGATFFTGAAT